MTDAKDPQDKPLEVIQFTDTHFFANTQDKLLGVDTFASFKEVLALAQAHRKAPDFYLLTGDISQDETAGSYQRFCEAIEHLESPIYYLPGNHDSRHILTMVFGAKIPLLKPDRNFLCKGWQIILLDSVIEKEVGGHLSPSELKRLDNALSQYPEHYALICLHHHPVPIGAKYLDEIGLDNAQSFLEIIDRHQQVRGILWGHVHQEFQTLRDGVLFISTPSTCVQFKPKSELFVLDEKPPGYRWLELTGSGSIITGVERLKALSPGLDLSATGY